MSLIALQSDFRTWLETGTDRAAARFAPEAQAGLLVYQNNYRAALMACLEESFARTAQWIGTDAFRASAARHIDACPPDGWSLDHYAGHFPQTLAAQWPDDPEVGELAALELTLSDAFIGPDAEPLVAACLPQVNWASAVLRWVPSACLLTMTTNAAAIWSALVAEAEPPAPCQLPEAMALLVWRQEYVSCFRTLDLHEHEIAGRIFTGMPFAEICAHLVEARGEAEGVQTAGIWLGSWVADGLLDRTGMV
jgi:hypothetical protein